MSPATVTKIKVSQGGPEDKVAHIRALNAQARSITQEVVDDALGSIEELARELASLAGLESARPGIRDRARQLAEQLVEEGKALQALHERAST